MTALKVVIQMKVFTFLGKSVMFWCKYVLINKNVIVHTFVRPYTVFFFSLYHEITYIES